MAPGSPVLPAADRAGLLARIAAYPGRALAACLALHAAVWTALPALLYPNLPLDLIEALIYGREWQLGYDKLPPLPWWLVETVNLTIGHDFAYYLLAELAVIAAFALVYMAARPLIGPLGALVAVLIVDGLHYFNYTAAKFNHDVIQLPFWALAGFAFHRALRGRQMTDWLLLGLAVGLSLWAKYFVAVLAMPMALFVLIDRDARKTLATPGPYIALAAALITMAPHLVWLVQNDFLPFAYAEHRAVLSRGWYDHVWHPLQFAVSQLFFLVPSLLIAAPLFWPRRKPDEPQAQPRADSLRPPHRHLARLRADGDGAGAVGRKRPRHGGDVGLPALAVPRRLAGADRAPRVRRPAAGAHSRHLGDRVRRPGRRLHRQLRRAAALRSPLPRGVLPGRDLGREIAARYRAVTGKPIAYVIGSMWDGGNVAHYAPSHPRVLIDGKPARAPWIDLADLRTRGAVVVWTAGDLHVMPPEFRTIAGDAAVQPPFLLHYRRGDSSLNVGWAILLPRPSYAEAPAN